METQVKQYDLIAIPDVHGRTFWKDALPYIENGTPVVFLGDYLDPYPHEGITPERALENFREILDVTKDRSNVTLLIGNHDFEYIVDDAPACRCDYDHYDEIRDLFQDNADRFYFGKQFLPDMATPPLILSHAGLHPMWYRELRAELATVLEPEKDEIGTLLFDRSVREILASPVKDTYIRLLNRVSGMRGGPNVYGSMIWADIREFSLQESLDMFGLQIVGHTMQVKKEYSDKEKGWFRWVPDDPCGLPSNIVCIDCQRCFGISHNPETSFYAIERVC